MMVLHSPDCLVDTMYGGILLMLGSYIRMKYAYYGHPTWYYTHLTVDTEYHSKYMVIINTVYGDVRTIYTVLFMIKYWYYSHPIWYYTHLTVDRYRVSK
jgi:hypothetical protein